MKFSIGFLVVVVVFLVGFLVVVVVVVGLVFRGFCGCLMTRVPLPFGLWMVIVPELLGFEGFLEGLGLAGCVGFT